MFRKFADPTTKLALLILSASFVPAGEGLQAQETGTSQNLLRNPDFADGLNHWQEYGGKGCFEILKNPGRTGRPRLQFQVRPNTSNVHLDQILELKKDTFYLASVRVQNEGIGLKPALRIADMDWATLQYFDTPAGPDGRTIQGIVFSGDSEQVRVQLFGAGRGRESQSGSGKVLFSGVAFRESNEKSLEEYLTCEIKIQPSKTIQPVNPLFFGVNGLFWIDDDAARADGKIGRSLHEMGCRLIRFPGGEVADNFHWRTNRLDDTRDFPFSDGPSKLDFDEFIVWKNEIGAEAICVVNLESGFKHGDVEAAVKEAAEWVRASNLVKKYGVKYWEIGNETNLVGTRYALTARQYAEAVVRFSRAMKAVDPTIQIGALGPISPTAGSALDSLSEESVQQLRQMKHWEVRKKWRKLEKRNEPPPAWWPTLVEVAGRNFDFAIIHRYDSSRKQMKKVYTPPMTIGRQVAELDAYLRKALGKEVPLALTEWNVGKGTKLEPISHALTIAELAGNYLTAGVDLANFWPMRYPKPKSGGGFRALLGFQSKEPRAAWYAMKLLATHIGSRLVPCIVNHPEVYGLATTSSEGRLAAIFLINRMNLSPGIRASLPASRTSGAEALSLVADGKSPGVQLKKIEVRKEGPNWRSLLPPRSLTVLRLNLELP